MKTDTERVLLGPSGLGPATLAMAEEKLNVNPDAFAWQGAAWAKPLKALCKQLHDVARAHREEPANTYLHKVGMAVGVAVEQTRQVLMATGYDTSRPYGPRHQTPQAEWARLAQVREAREAQDHRMVAMHDKLQVLVPVVADRLHRLFDTVAHLEIEVAALKAAQPKPAPVCPGSNELMLACLATRSAPSASLREENPVSREGAKSAEKTPPNVGGHKAEGGGA